MFITINNPLILQVSISSFLTEWYCPIKLIDWLESYLCTIVWCITYLGGYKYKAQSNSLSSFLEIYMVDYLIKTQLYIYIYISSKN